MKAELIINFSFASKYVDKSIINWGRPNRLKLFINKIWYGKNN